MEISFRPNSLTLQWHITERCNWRCKHCYQESYTTPEMKLPELLRVRDQFLELLDSFNPPLGRARINITGGEPFARTDIMEFLSGIAQYNHRWSWALLSNGSFLNKENVKYLRGLGIKMFQVSMEGLEKTNDEIRGEGAFQKTLKAIEFLTEAGIETVVSLTLSRKNKEDIEGLAKILAERRVKTLGIRRIIPWGQGEQMKKYLLEPPELSDLYRQIESINTRLIDTGYNLRVGGGCESGLFYNDVKIHPETGENLMTKNTCGVKEGRTMVVLPDGAVFPCRRLPIPVGKLFEKSLIEIYHSPALRAFRDFEKAPAFSICRSCPNWSNCRGGAPCVNYGFTKKWNIPDVQCNKLFRSLEEAAHFAQTL